MKWIPKTKEQKFQEKAQRLCRWHEWFAWYPVNIVHPQTSVRHTVWLEYVGRKFTVKTQFNSVDWSQSKIIDQPVFCFKEDVVLNTLAEDHENIYDDE